ncbi:MAG: FKBP-type peptidyl-prolyl cis-trans isomerase [Desulfarculus sp.]|nr:FKBP-type peptidyl-prolyl cis-trans isomerase [Desulfarculus sp.]
MKKILLPVLALCLVASQSWAAAPSSPEQKLSYTLGFRMGSDIKSREVKVDLESFQQGFKDAQGGAKPQLSEEDMAQILQNLTREIQAKEMAKIKALADKNLAEGKKFLEENKAKEGVKTTASGLQYKALASGKGKAPKLSDTVTVNYQGRLLDGTVFDDSLQRGEPASFPLDSIIKGWQEALQLMKEGDKWEIYVPSDLAFGPQGAGGPIGPNQVLVFNLELIKVAPAPAKDNKPAAKDKPAKEKAPKKEAK